MMIVVEETAKREKEQIEAHEQKIEELNFGLDLINEQQRLEQPDNNEGSRSSSVDKVKPFSNELT
jgi:hypothetical protein